MDLGCRECRNGHVSELTSCHGTVLGIQLRAPRPDHRAAQVLEMSKKELLHTNEALEAAKRLEIQAKRAVSRPKDQKIRRNASKYDDLRAISNYFSSTFTCFLLSLALRCLLRCVRCHFCCRFCCTLGNRSKELACHGLTASRWLVGSS